jgi:hypothetical protein
MLKKIIMASIASIILFLLFTALSILIPGEIICIKPDVNADDVNNIPVVETEFCDRESSIFKPFEDLFFTLSILLVLISEVIASIEIIKTKKRTISKLFWLFLIWLVLSILGVIIFYFFGREKDVYESEELF